MGVPGPAPKPYLQVVREGNPSGKPLEPGVVLPPSDLEEPDWLETFPSGRDKEAQAVNRRAREVARKEWRRVVPVLKHSSGLADVDMQVARDYCICVARIDQCERELSTNGLMQLGQRGWQKNGATTIVGQYRTQLRSYIGELGLSPSARTRLTPREAESDDADPFD
jgi:P27 family predicted phage terminase small subunit